ncbi:FAD-dependent oxidoreductase [Rhodohalobacter halophilus]|uniref:FAD-dependent oxidoreductase n=1 Tax=Rhodohalobacter halophilus TaxID=1812810 RepID=UPI00083FB585|nr:NAD(P)/FAD-dependent oxidoreductase [Rhodohalobacter halophilus]
MDITIVGGGPVGLYLAIRFVQNGFSCRVLEKRTEIDQHSKSLGIHPVSLDLFDQSGITQPFLRYGLKIESGLAFLDYKLAGEVSFRSCPPPHAYILAIPQWKTEEILENKLRDLDRTVLIRGAEVQDIQEINNRVEISYTQEDEKHHLSSDYVIGCDGKHSVVRNSCNIPFEGNSYPDTYMMGDFEDNTEFGNQAAVYLHKKGLVESFPLPSGQRRWVVKTDHYFETPNVKKLTEEVFIRTGYHLGSCENNMLSSFGVQHLMAKTFAYGRMVLAGDAAHIVSPIGGQGMNLGWLDAEACLETFLRIRYSPERQKSELQKYSNQQRRIAQQVAKRANMNMVLGRKESANIWIRNGLKVVLNSPLKHLLARLFTMRGLGRWPV